MNQIILLVKVIYIHDVPKVSVLTTDWFPLLAYPESGLHHSVAYSGPGRGCWTFSRAPHLLTNNWGLECRLTNKHCLWAELLSPLFSIHSFFTWGQTLRYLNSSTWRSYSSPANVKTRVLDLELHIFVLMNSEDWRSVFDEAKKPPKKHHLPKAETGSLTDKLPCLVLPFWNFIAWSIV